jgi:signal transduction histidine kinase
VGLTQVAIIAQDLAAAGFAALGVLVSLQWYRKRNRAEGKLALALVFLAVVAVGGRLQDPAHPPLLLSAVEIVAFMLSGFFVLLFRNEFIPLSQTALRAAYGLLALSIVAGLVDITLATHAGGAVTTLLALVLIGAWAIFTGEPIVRFWLASNSLPGVQKARMRALSFGFAVLIAILFVDVLGGSALQSPLAITITQLLALAVVPVIYVSFAPPSILRRIWRMGEENALRGAMQDLLIFSPDRSTMAEKASVWAMRLVGARGAFIVDSDGSLMAATPGLDAAMVEGIMATRTGSLEGLLGVAGEEGSQIITVPLHLSEGPGAMGVIAGPFTPLFGTEEVIQLGSYANAVTAGLERARVTERIAALEKSKSQFLNLASHELRGPMTVIRGYVSMMEDGILGPLNERGRKAAEVMDAKVSEMSALIEQMIESARLEEGGLIADLKVTDLRDIARNAVESARPLVDKNHELTLKVPRRPVEVRVDVERSQTIITNLISNALKYSPAGGAVHCEVSAAKGEALVTVKDEGIGIAPQHMSALFTRFGRVMTPETQHLPGTGLGLYLSRQLARLQGGDITVESKPGRGSTFALHLPEVGAAAPEPEPRLSDAETAFRQD